jgi:hypothetical protein
VRGAARWVRIGCGATAALLVAVGGLAGWAAWKFSKGVKELDGTAEAWLRTRPELEALFGPSPRMERRPAYVITIENDRGEARFDYAVAGERGSGTAQVWLDRRAGQWIGRAARLQAAGRDVAIGTPP